MFLMFHEMQYPNHATYMFQVRDFISSTISFKNSKRLNDEGYTLIDFISSQTFFQLDFFLSF